MDSLTDWVETRIGKRPSENFQNPPSRTAVFNFLTDVRQSLLLKLNKYVHFAMHLMHAAGN